MPSLGIISDTHNFFDPRLPSLFRGVQHILHAGDIGAQRILLQLQQIAPVTAVSGNTDDSSVHPRQTAVVELCKRKFLLHHIVEPSFLDSSLAERIEGEKPDVVVFGHTHKPFAQTIDGILFFNPGYAGKMRFNLPRSVALLHCDEKTLRHEYINL